MLFGISARICPLVLTKANHGSNGLGQFLLFSFIMAKIFYCGGLSGRLGMLRAVVPLDDLHSVFSKDSSKYVGKTFPKMKEAATVIEIAPDERGLWKAGFYRATKGPLDFEEQLRGM